MPDPSDRALATRARAGDADAYGELVQRYQASVFAVCYRLVGERREAEDLTQDTFIRAFQRLATYDLAQPFGPWIRRVAAHVTLNRLARTHPTATLDDERATDAPPPDSTPGPEAAREHSERAEALRAAILALPPHYRAVIELRHYQELSYAEIAATLNLSLSDVKTFLFRARKRLAEHLHDYAP